MNLKKDALQYFWILLGCCTMSAASMGICIYASGVFFQAVSSGLAIPLSTVSFTTTLTMIAMALTTLLLPILFKRVPYRYLLIGSAALALSGILGMSFSFDFFWLDVFSVLKGIGAAGFGLVPVTYIINNWFHAKRDFITGVAISASAVGGALMNYILGASVQGLGWRMGYVIQAILLGILLLPPFLLPFTLDPRGLSMDPYGKNEKQTKREGKKNPRNLLFLGIIAILASLLVGVPQYFSGYASFLGQSAMLGVSLLSYALIGNFVFKILGGLLADRIGILYTALGLAVVTLFADIGLALCEFSYSQITIVSMAFLFGAAYALAEFCLPLLVAYFFGKHRYIRIYSLVSAFSIFTAAISIVILGSGIDLFGSYSWIWLVSALFLVAILYLLWTLSGHRLDMGIKVQKEKAAASVAETPSSVVPESKKSTRLSRRERQKDVYEISEEQINPYEGVMEVTDIVLEETSKEEKQSEQSPKQDSKQSSARNSDLKLKLDKDQDEKTQEKQNPDQKQS